jgi:hypothetical protein
MRKRRSEAYMKYTKRKPKQERGRGEKHPKNPKIGVNP